MNTGVIKKFWFSSPLIELCVFPRAVQEKWPSYRLVRSVRRAHLSLGRLQLGLLSPGLGPVDAPQVVQTSYGSGALWMITHM